MGRFVKSRDHSEELTLGHTSLKFSMSPDGSAKGNEKEIIWYWITLPRGYGVALK